MSKYRVFSGPYLDSFHVVIPTTENTNRRYRSGKHHRILFGFFSYFSRCNLFNQYNFKMAAPKEQTIMQ